MRDALKLIYTEKIILLKDLKI